MHGLLNEINKIAFIIAPIFYKVIFMSITATLTGLFILLIEKLFDKHILPIWKYIMWMIMIIALIIPYRPKSNFSIVSNLDNVQNISYREEYDLIRSKNNYESISENEIEIEDMKKENTKIFYKSAVFDVILPIIWLIGVFSFAIYFLFSRIFFINNIIKNSKNDSDILNLKNECCIKLKIHKKISVFIQDIITTPAITGIIKPKIILPSYSKEIDKNQLKYIILHELGHYKRKDLWLNELLLILNCIYWFNPFIIFLFKKVRFDMEVLNDSYILEKIGDAESKSYAKSLVTVLERTNNILCTQKLVCMSDGYSNVERRITMIKLKNDFKKNKIIISIFCILIIGIIGILFLTTNSNITPIEAIEGLENSINYKNGILSFTIPENYPSDKWDIHISGRSEFPDGMSMSNHFFEEIEWEKR